MPSYREEVYIRKAIEQNLVMDPSEIGEFKLGHLRGIAAISKIFEVKERCCTFAVPRLQKRVIASTIEKLQTGYYDGKSVDSIVKEATAILGERVTLYRAIIEANSSGQFLSKDCKYALPLYTRKEIDISDNHFSKYDDLHEAISKDSPHSRNDLLRFFDTYKVRPKDLDAAIQYLILKRLI